MANSVIIKNYLKVFEEYAAQATITPGHLLKLRSDGKVQATDADQTTQLPMFATEDELQGKTITDNYSANDIVQCWIPQRGEVVNAILTTSQTIVIGDYLTSAGDGTLKKYEATTLTGSDSGTSIPDAKVIGQAVQAVTTTGSAARIKVRII